VGSVIFGGPPGPRYIPGLGASRPPEIGAELATLHNVKDVVMVPEPDTIRMCHEVLDRYSLGVGGSTGTVLCGVRRYRDRLAPDATVVAISADMGERYAATVYNPDWVAEKLGVQL